MTWAEDLAVDDGAEEEVAPPLFYENVAEFVSNYLIHIYARNIEDSRAHVWCPEWWNHAEAIARLEAMWRAWEHARQDNAEGPSNWWLQHADGHMRVLLNADDGPFRNCRKQQHDSRMKPLPVTAPPPGLF